MMECELCMAMTKDELRLYEDPNIVVILHPNGATPGHMLILPKTHYPIMESVPDELLNQLFEVAKVIGRSLGVRLGQKDFNLVITNGVEQHFPHFSMHLIPRGAEDNVKLKWEEVPIADMESIQQKLKGGPIKEEEPVEISHMRRIP